VIALLYAEQLGVAEVSKVLQIPSSRVIAIDALVQCRVRVAVTRTLSHRAQPLWTDSKPLLVRTSVPSRLRALPFRRRALPAGYWSTIRPHRHAVHS